MFAVEGPDRSEGALFFGFDDVDRLDSYGWARDDQTSAAEIVSTLSRQLGEPNAKDVPVKTFNGVGKLTSWTSTACETVVSVVEDHRIFDDADHVLVLVSLGGRSALQRIEKETQQRAASAIK